MIGKIIRTRFFKTVTPGIDLKVLIPCVPGSSQFYVTIQYFHLTATNTSTNITHTVIIAYFTVLIIGCIISGLCGKKIALSFSSLVLVTIAPPQDVIILFPLKDNEAMVPNVPHFSLYRNFLMPLHYLLK
jgi:CBS domain containing-hemolysin-like protein